MAIAFRVVSRPSLVVAGAAAIASLFPLVPTRASAVSLDQACGMFASKLSAAVQAGDQAKAQTIYQEGSQRIAQRFNGATCPNVQPPAGN